MSGNEELVLLEMSELEQGPDGGLPESLTLQLAHYLVQGELSEAKFLWKRSSTLLKENPEFRALWMLGQKLWVKDIVGFYGTIGSHEWSPPIQDLMNQLLVSTRASMIKLIGTAYTSIKPEDVSALTGMPLHDIPNLVNQLGWTVYEGLILPTEPKTEETIVTSAEIQLQKLTDYVTFLEN